jgi:hypothetical protein
MQAGQPQPKQERSSAPPLPRKKDAIPTTEDDALAHALKMLGDALQSKKT